MVKTLDYVETEATRYGRIYWDAHAAMKKLETALYGVEFTDGPTADECRKLVAEVARYLADIPDALAYYDDQSVRRTRLV